MSSGAGQYPFVGALNGAITFFVGGDGNVSAPNVFIMTDADDTSQFVIDEENTTDDDYPIRMYNGPTIDVKERILNFQSRLSAMEANEVVDDATDSALLQLVASLSNRLDARDQQVDDLIARIQALEA